MYKLVSWCRPTMSSLTHLIIRAIFLLHLWVRPLMYLKEKKRPHQETILYTSARIYAFVISVFFNAFCIIQAFLVSSQVSFRITSFHFCTPLHWTPAPSYNSFISYSAASGSRGFSICRQSLTTFSQSKSATFFSLHIQYIMYYLPSNVQSLFRLLNSVTAASNRKTRHWMALISFEIEPWSFWHIATDYISSIMLEENSE